MIAAGDLVYVWQAPHSCSSAWLGVVFVVARIHPLNPVCTGCGRDVCEGEPSAAHPTGHHLPVSWLRRLSPPAKALDAPPVPVELVTA